MSIITIVIVSITGSSKNINAEFVTFKRMRACKAGQIPRPDSEDI
jgi:hypothetical protein